MRIAIISDLHLGDTNSAIAFRDPSTVGFLVGSRYKEFIEKVKEKYNGKELDYLVLLGDILDFSVTSYSDAYAIGQFFFQKLKDDKIAEEIIYVPGNHDFDLWHTVEYQTNVTNRIKNKKLPIPFRMSIPGIIDDREGEPTKGFTIHNVRAQIVKGKRKYAGLFLDSITEPPTPFNFVYPNIYFITKDETVLITHGQYQELYWSVLGKWGLKIINGDLEIKNLKLLDLKEMVAINFPLCQLGCSAIGQAGPLTTVIQKFEHEIKEHDVTRAETYLNRLGNELKKHSRGIGGWFKRLAFNLGKREVLKTLSHMESSRYRIEFLEDPEVRERFKDFYSSTVYEISQIKDKYGIDIPLPTRMIFGHTHQPIPWEWPEAPSIDLPQLPKGKKFFMYNTGGWLNRMDKNNQLQFCGAEIFFYDTDEGFSSVNIGYNPEDVRYISPTT